MHTCMFQTLLQTWCARNVKSMLSGVIMGGLCSQKQSEAAALEVAIRTLTCGGQLVATIVFCMHDQFCV